MYLTDTCDQLCPISRAIGGGVYLHHKDVPQLKIKPINVDNRIYSVQRHTQFYKLIRQKVWAYFSRHHLALI